MSDVLIYAALACFALAWVLVMVAVLKPTPITVPSVESRIAYHSRPRTVAVQIDAREQMIVSFAQLQKRGR